MAVRLGFLRRDARRRWQCAEGFLRSEGETEGGDGSARKPDNGKIDSVLAAGSDGSGSETLEEEKRTSVTCGSLHLCIEHSLPLSVLGIINKVHMGHLIILQ